MKSAGKTWKQSLRKYVSYLHCTSLCLRPMLTNHAKRLFKFNDWSVTYYLFTYFLPYNPTVFSVSTASQQIDVFSRILKTSVASILRFRGSSLENIISDLVKLVCFS